MNKAFQTVLILTAVVGLTATILVAPESAKEDPPMLNYVPLMVVDSEGNPQGRGTGLAITPTRVATCFHMLETDNFVVYQDPETGNALVSTVLVATPDRDFTVIEFTKVVGNPQKNMVFADASVGDKIHSVANIFGKGPMYWEGYVSKVEGKLTYFFPSIPSGGSGSAIYNEKGEIVGMAKGFIVSENGHLSVGIMIPSKVFKDIVVQAQAFKAPSEKKEESK